MFLNLVVAQLQRSLTNIFILVSVMIGICDTCDSVFRGLAQYEFHMNDHSNCAAFVLSDLNWNSSSTYPFELGSLKAEVVDFDSLFFPLTLTIENGSVLVSGQ